MTPVNRVARVVNKYMPGFLEESLDEMSSFLRVLPDSAHFILAFQKEFSLTVNYPKGHGEKFKSWIIKRYSQ